MIPKFITVHCSASKAGVNVTAEAIRKQHKAKGWRDIGYHYVIRLDGVIEEGRRESMQGAHVRYHNKDNIGICLIGGLDISGQPAQTYEPEQYSALYILIRRLCKQYHIPLDEVQGHRDWYGDSRSDWMKECPCFDVRDWLLLRVMNSTE